MSSLQKEPKIYGAVESQSYITFTGFCKRIYDTTQQSVDVFIDDVKIDTIQANQKIADIENKYEVFDTNGFCFTYELPKEYIGQKHKLEFKTQDGEQLLHSPTHTLDKFSPLYNQAMFIESLKEPLKYNAIDNGYTKNALSFIAIEENLSDEDFIEFVLEMCKKHKELSLSIVYFNEHQKNQANKVLSQVKNKSFFNPSSVEELIKNSEIYLYNVVEEFRFTLNEEYYNKVKNIQAIKENLFTIELTRKAKKKKDMAEMVVDTVTPILFETSVVSQMFKEDERYNEFVFMNSLGRVDEEKIKDMYCPNSIGFLATKENLADEEFMGYIKELMVRFPDVEFKGFCFDTQEMKLTKELFYQKTKVYLVDSIFELLNKIEIFIYTPLQIKIKNYILNNNNEIIPLIFHYKHNFENNQYLAISKVIINNYSILSFSKEDLDNSNGLQPLLVHNKFLIKIDKKLVLGKESNLYNFILFDLIQHLLIHKNYKAYLLGFYKKLFTLINSLQGRV
ncbi:MAG: hypothetical protein WCY75_05200 [Sulfurimonadaceae bacterium]